jgi:hypothetical protein
MDHPLENATEPREVADLIAKGYDLLTAGAGEFVSQFSAS